MQTRREVLITRTAATATLAVALMLAVDTASATPYFANQTKLDCLSCHRNAPTGRDAANDLTRAGRRFKDSGFDPKIFSSPRSPPTQVCHNEIRHGRSVEVCTDNRDNDGDD